MNIVIFLIGFVAGAVLALILQMVVAKRAGNAEAEMQKRDFISVCRPSLKILR